MTSSSTPINILRSSVALLMILPSMSSGASGPKKLPVCDGKHLRDVNIYGSVLPGSPVPGVVAPPAPPPVPPVIQPPEGASAPPPVPVPAPDKTSMRDAPRNHGSC